MKIIGEADKTIDSLWGKAQFHGEGYRLIQFHVQCRCDDGLLLLNTVTGELVLLNQEEAEALQKLSESTVGEMLDLISHHFLVPYDYDEVRTIDQLRKITRRLSANEEITGYSILPTTGCNAKCFYCFESSYPRKTMTSELADLVVDYMEKHCGNKEISIHWFGGEPMVGHVRIDQICERLIEKGIQFTSTMYSNGSLFSKDLAHKAHEKWNLRFVQITMDGSEEVYIKTKAYSGLTVNPYYLVLDNIGYLLEEGIRISIRLNLDFHNSEDLSTLIDELAERFRSYKNFSIYVHELFEDEGFEPIHHSREQWKELEERRVALEKYIEEKGCITARERKVGKRLPALKTYYCMADNPSSIMINPDGQLGKCEHHVFKHLVGDIHGEGDGRDCDAMGYWMNFEMAEYCKKCPLYPSCGIPEVCEGGNDCRSEQTVHKIADTQTHMLRFYNHYKVKNEGGN